MNLYARDGDGNEFKSKTALRNAVKQQVPVLLTDTAAFNSRGTFNLWNGLHQLDRSDVIIGPNPYRDRRWYANIVVNRKTGKVSVQ